MTKRKPGWSWWWAQGPLGPLGHKLGFRWIFPFGTLPFPFHPLAMPLVLALLAGWMGWSVLGQLAGAGDGWAWAWPLLAAVGLGAIMSLPFYGTAIFMFGGRLIQGLLILWGLVTLTAGVLAGNVDPQGFAIPVGYIALFLIQAGFGRLWVRRLTRENAAFAALIPGQTTVALERWVHNPVALVRSHKIARLHCPGKFGNRAMMHHALAPADAAAFTGPDAPKLPTWWKIEEWRGQTVLSRPCRYPPRDAVRIDRRPHRAPFWLVTGLTECVAFGAGVSQRAVAGTARTVVPIPLMSGILWIPINGGRQEWMIGFPRRNEAPLAMPPEVAPHGEAGAIALRQPDDLTFEEAQLPLLAELVDRFTVAEKVRRDKLIAGQDQFWAAMPGFVALPRRWRAIHQALGETPEALVGRDPTPPIDWFERARDAREALTLTFIVRLLEAFPDAALAPHADRLHTIFNSRKLAHQWKLQDVPDVNALPRQTPFFLRSIAGFGLFLARPGFYAKLAGLSPALAKLERGLKQEIADPEPGLATSFTLILNDRAATG